MWAEVEGGLVAGAAGGVDLLVGLGGHTWGGATRGIRVEWAEGSGDARSEGEGEGWGDKGGEARAFPTHGGGGGPEWRRKVGRVGLARWRVVVGIGG